MEALAREFRVNVTSNENDRKHWIKKADGFKRIGKKSPQVSGDSGDLDGVLAYGL